MFEYLITTELNNAMNTIDLNEYRAIKRINRVDNVRKRLLKNMGDLELQYYLIQLVYNMAVEYRNEKLTALYKKMIGESDIKNKKINWQEIRHHKDFYFYLIWCGMPVYLLLIFMLLGLIS